MRQIVLSALLTVLLLSGCASTRQGGGEAVCDCQRAVKVPDKAFRTFLLDSGYAVKAGWQRLKPTAAGCALTMLECYGRDIHSLEGIEMFPQLEELTCSDNPITELDLSGNPAMHELHALDTPLQTILVTPAQYDGGVRASVSDSVQVIVGKAG